MSLVFPVFTFNEVLFHSLQNWIPDSFASHKSVVCVEFP